MITEVYYIPRLRRNIVSLGQHDEIGCKIIMEDGILSILDCDRVLLAKVQWSENRLLPAESTFDRTSLSIDKRIKRSMALPYKVWTSKFSLAAKFVSIEYGRWYTENSES